MGSKSSKRWRIPLALSIVVNLYLFCAVGRWYGNLAPYVAKVISARSIVLVRPPIAAKLHQQIAVKPAVDQRAAEPDAKQGMASAGGSQHKAIVRTRAVQVASAAPASSNQPPQAADRDPFQPAVAPSAIVHVDPNNQHSVALPTPTVAISKPTQISSITGNGLTTSLQPGNYNSGTVASSGTGAGQAGGGGNGNGSGNGVGSGNGGVLPFELGGGRGGQGTHRIVYVLDISPSMTSRIDRAKQELRNCLASLSPDDLFDIIAFGGETIKMEDYLEPATSDDLREADHFLNILTLMPSTNLEEALSEALNISHVNEIVVLTDGVPTSGETDFSTLARELRNRNIYHVRIDTIGLVGRNPDGSDQSFDATRLLRQISKDSGGDSKLVTLGIASND